MLRTRILTAICLLAIVLPAVATEMTWIWSLVALGFAVLAAREWRRMQADCRSEQDAGRALAFASVVLVAGLAWMGLEVWQPDLSHQLAIVVLGLAALFWVTLGPMRLRTQALDGGGAWLAGALVFACWVGLVELRQVGIVPLVVALLIVWIADIGAYFVGRGFGRRKLAPTISPGKSWEGAFGGAFFVAVFGLIAAASPAMVNTLPERLVVSVGPLLAAVVLLLLAALSVVGDLYESALKRQAGVKDSGRTLPGHGGVLDRIDALIPVIPCIALLHKVLP
ncbi:MAG: phosphatidate cytidylyltransferase [Burkholderiaceae bacterium]